MSAAEANQLVVVMDDGASVVVPQPRPADLVRWERYARSRGIQANAQEGSVEQVMYLAFIATHRDVSPLPDFDAWCDSVVELRGGDAQDPSFTPMAASGG